MPSYNHYVRLGFSLYEVSSLDSSHYVEYVQKNRSDCNVLNISSKQLLVISTQHLYTEAELKKVEKRVVCFRKQKKIQREKLIRTISRGIFDMEELEKIETKEAVRFIQAEPSTFRKQQMYSPSSIVGLFRIDWSFLSDFAFDLGLLADLGILENIETFPDIQLNS